MTDAFKDIDYSKLTEPDNELEELCYFFDNISTTFDERKSTVINEPSYCECKSSNICKYCSKQIKIYGKWKINNMLFNL
jgi:hypothetical protein